MRLRPAPRSRLLALLVCCFAPPAVAQHWQVDIGATSVAHDTFSSVASGVVAPSVEWLGRRSYGLAGGSIAAFGGGGWTAQGRGDVSLFLPAVVELTGTLAGSVHSTGYRTGTTRGELRLHLSGRGGGVWAGGHIGTGWTSSATRIAVAFGPAAGAWARLGGWNAVATFVPFRYEESWFPEVNARLAGSARGRRLDLLAFGGWRGAPQGLEEAVWGGASLAWWITPRVALVGSAGTYPLDVLQALPKGRYVSASIRLSPRAPSVWATGGVTRAAYALPHGTTELRFVVPGATRVSVVGDWTRWQPVPLERAADDAWVMRVTLSRGVYRFNLIVDGSRWTVPAEVAAVDDGYGGKTALLVVP